MSDDHIKNALQEAVKQLAEVGQQQDELERQRLELQKQGFKILTKIHGLAALCDDLPPSSPVALIVKQIERDGITNAIRNILHGVGEWMSPAQIRDQMIRFRIDLTRYKNPLGSIHTILGRLAESGEIEQGIDEKTKKAIYRAKPHFLLDRYSTEEVADAMIQPTRGKKRNKGQ